MCLKGGAIIMRSEKRGGAYRELEQELIEESIDRFIASNRKQSPENDLFKEDPRIAATIAETNARGFSMEEGRYIDLSK